MLIRLLSTQILAQGFSAISFILVHTFLGLEGYGFLNTILAYLSLTQILSLPFLDRELLLNFKKMSKANIDELFSFKIFLSILSSFLFGILLSKVFGQDLGLLLGLILFMPFSASASSMYISVIYSNKDDKYLSKVLLLKNITGSLFILVSSFYYKDFKMVLLFKFIHELIFIFYSQKYIYSFGFRRNLDVWKYVVLTKKYMPFYLGNYLNFRADIVLLERIASPLEVGLYSLVFRIVEKISTSFNVYYKHLMAKDLSPYSNRLKILGFNVFLYVLVLLLLRLGLIYKSFDNVEGLFLIYGLVLFVLIFSSEENNQYQRRGDFWRLGIVNFWTGIFNLFVSIVGYKLFGLTGVAIATIVSYSINVSSLKYLRNV